MGFFYFLSFNPNSTPDAMLVLPSTLMPSIELFIVSLFFGVFLNHGRTVWLPVENATMDILLSIN
jgi:hypothetical protein